VLIAPQIAGELPKLDKYYRDLVDVLQAIGFDTGIQGQSGAKVSDHLAIYLVNRLTQDNGDLAVIAAAVIGTIGRRAARAERKKSTLLLILGPDDRPAVEIDLPGNPEHAVIARPISHPRLVGPDGQYIGRPSDDLDDDAGSEFMVPVRYAAWNDETHAVIDPEDAARYCVALDEMRIRLENIAPLLTQEWITQADVELSALHVRKVLELIVMSSLAANRRAIAAIASAFASKDVSEVRKLARQVNSLYWPQPVRLERAGVGVVSDEPLEGALREEDWGKAYGYVSNLLHVSNPYNKPFDLAHAPEKVIQIRNELVTLLDHHVIYLADQNYMLDAVLKARGKAAVQVLAATKEFRSSYKAREGAIQESGTCDAEPR